MQDKKKIIIWGVEAAARKFYHYLDHDHVEVIAYTYSMCKERVDDLYFGVPCIPPEDALKLAYDYIVIANRTCFCEITVQLIEKGVNKEKIVQAYNTYYMLPETLFYFDEIDLDRGKRALFTSLACMIVRGE